MYLVFFFFILIIYIDVIIKRLNVVFLMMVNVFKEFLFELFILRDLIDLKVVRRIFGVLFFRVIRVRFVIVLFYMNICIFFILFFFGFYCFIVFFLLVKILILFMNIFEEMVILRKK